MKLPPFAKYAFNQQGEKTDIYRHSTTTTKDTFGRAVAIEPTIVHRQVTILRNQSSQLPNLQNNPDAVKGILKGSYYLPLTYEVKPSDTFTANGLEWVVIKVIQTHALGLQELFVETP